MPWSLNRLPCHAMQEQNQVKSIQLKSLMQVRSGQACTPLAGPFRAQAQNESILHACYTKLNQTALCTTKFDEKFAMLIPKVVIHSNVNPSPKAFVPAECMCANVFEKYLRGYWAVHETGGPIRHTGFTPGMGKDIISHASSTAWAGAEYLSVYHNPYHFNSYIIWKHIRILGRVTSFFGTHGLDVGSSGVRKARRVRRPPRHMPESKTREHSSQSQSLLARRQHFRGQAEEMSKLRIIYCGRWSSKIPFHQHQMITCSSLHNWISKALRDGIFLDRCFPSSAGR